MPRPLSPLSRYCSVAAIDCLGSKLEHGILFKSLDLEYYSTLAVAKVPLATWTDG